MTESVSWYNTFSFSWSRTSFNFRRAQGVVKVAKKIFVFVNEVVNVNPRYLDDVVVDDLKI